MPATTTFKALIEELLERTGLGFVLGTVTGTTTGWTASTSYVKGPFTTQRFARGSPMLLTAGTAINQATYLDTYTPSSGAGTIEPDASDTWSDAVLIYLGNGIDHPDRIKEAINRSHQNRCGVWRMVPLTYVPDGDLLGATVTDYWTASAGTASYVSLTHPETGGARGVQISHSSAANIQSNTIPARSDEVWEFETAIRAGSDGDTATLSVQDVTNSTAITVSYQEGTGTTTSRALVTQKGQFTVPASSDRIAFRLAVSGSGTMVAQMAPIVAAPRDAMAFPLQNRVRRIEDIGNFFYAFSGGTTTGPEERRFVGPLTLGGKTHAFHDAGDHMNVSFNFIPSQAVWYEEFVYGAALSALTDTTTYDDELVLAWAKYELYKYLYDRDQKWRLKVIEAKAAAERYRTHPKTVVGRVA